MMKILYATSSVLLLLLIFYSAAEDEPIHYNDYVTIRSYYIGGKRYISAVSNSIFEKMTSWSIQDSKPPPVSAQQAFALASRCSKKIVLPKGEVWINDKVSLEALPERASGIKWIWHVNFILQTTDPPIRTMGLFVTMDGELIELIVIARKKP